MALRNDLCSPLNTALVVAWVLAADPGDAARAAVIQLGPTPYLSAADSPLLADPTLVTTIEDFEDGVFNLPGVVNVPIPPGPNRTGDGIGIVVGPGPETDSVDGDDGVIDGFGRAGHSLRSNSFFDFTVWESSISLCFEPDPHGNYPTAFGFVWTDGETDSHIGFIGHEANAAGEFDFGHAESSGDMAFTGETGEDEFYGVRSASGLLAVTIISSRFALIGIDPRVNYFEMDHLQISYNRVPEARASIQAALGLVLLSINGFRRQQVAKTGTSLCLVRETNVHSTRTGKLQ